MKCLRNVLCLGLSILLLPGCTQNPPAVIDEKPQKSKGDIVNYKIEKDKSIVRDSKVYSLNDNTALYNTLLGVYSEEYLEVKDYKNYPDDEFNYPYGYVDNGDLKLAFLKSEDIKNSPKIENMQLSVTYGDMYNSGGSVIDSITSIFSNSASDTATAEVSEALPMEMGLSFENFNMNNYNPVEESNYLLTKTNPLSTFAADVDTASYTFLKTRLKTYALNNIKEIENNNLDTSGVRVEEVINYFDYDVNYNQIEDSPFYVSSEISQTPWNSETQLLTLNLKTEDLTEDKYMGSNIVFLLDTSGSMSGVDRLGLVKESIKLLANELSEKDTVSIITYSNNAEVLLEDCKGSDKERIIEVVDSLETSGGTNGEAGLRKAYEILDKYNSDYNNRIIVCSDGDFNIGISSESELTEFVEDNRSSNCYITLLGFGMGNFKDNMMETIADNGNGNYFYINDISEAYKVLVEDILSTLKTVADDVKFQIEFNPEYIKGYRKIGYENRNLDNQDFEDDTKDGGEIGYDHEITLVYELVPVDSNLKLSDEDLKYQESVSTGSTDWFTLSVNYKNLGEKESTTCSYIVNESSYTDEPTDNWKFISNAVGFVLLLNDSDYIEGYSTKDVENAIDNIETGVESYKLEFLSLVKMYNSII